MRSYQHWQKALVLSIVMNGVLFMGLGGLAHTEETSPLSDESFEMELADLNLSEQTEFQPKAVLQSASQGGISEKPQATRTVGSEPTRQNMSLTSNMNSSSSLSSVINDDGEVAPSGEVEPALTVGMESKKVEEPKNDTILPPQIIHQEPPIYPQQARRLGWSGVVRVRVEVLTTGQVGDVQVEQSSGYSIIDEAAIQSARQWQFRAARYSSSGLKVRSYAPVPIRFNLRQ